MLPYYTIDRIPLIGSDPFAFFYFLGYLAGYLFSLKRSGEKGITYKEFTEFFCFTVIPTHFGAHWFHVLAYDPAAFRSNPLVLLDINAGLASLGGILSFCIFFPTYLKLKGRIGEWRMWFDISVQGLIVGLMTGRIGCALLHDHRGDFSDFFLAVRFPEGARHDLGLYELLYLALIVFPLSVWINKKNFRPGLQAAAFCFSYGPARFLMEFLRTSDPRYFGLTPAQFGSFIIIGIGTYLLVSGKDRS